MCKSQLKSTVAVAFALATLTPLAAPAATWAQPDNGDNGLVGVAGSVAGKISGIKGTVVDYDNYKNYVTIGRPDADNSKKFLLYNVGTGKFLNLGGYWGTHAALSDVPRPFWFQRRNEQKVSQWSYLRYPETSGDVLEPDANYQTAVTPLLSVSSLCAGSAEGKVRTKATYKEVSIVNTVNPNDFIKTYSGNLTGKVIEAKIDLSNCETGNECLLSIGNDVKTWGVDNNGKGDGNNIHMYYKTDGRVLIYAVNSDTTDKFYQYVTIGSNKELDVKLSSDGLFINGSLLTSWDNTNFDSSCSVIKNLCDNATQIQIGNKEGVNRSNATYESVTLTENGTVTNVLADKVVKNVFDNKELAGKALVSDTFKPNFADGDILKAVIDLSKCDTKTENVFSVGENIRVWGQSEAKNNIHIYYMGADDNNYKLYAAYVNKDHSDDLKRAFTVPKGKDMELKLSKEGLTVNGTNLYPSVDPMPEVEYNADLAGEIVRVKFDENMIPEIGTDGKYVIDQDGSNSHGIKVQHTGYFYTDESRTDKTMPLFISSNFVQESTSTENEGPYFSWAPYVDNISWGVIGAFGDRALPQKAVYDKYGADKSVEFSQWYFEPAEPQIHDAESGHNLYRIYLKMSDVEDQQLVDNLGPGYDFSKDHGYNLVTNKGRHNYYLQASKVEVLGNALQYYGNTWKEEESTSTNNDYTNAEAVASDDFDDNALWKVISIDEYNELFSASQKNMESDIDLTYTLHDPDFTRKNYELPNWHMDDGLAGKVRIGFDEYSKKKLDDTDYTDDNGKKIGEDGVSSDHVWVSDHVNNHSRYMGVDVRNGGYGKFWQEVNLTHAGWYVISCGGMSNVGAKLFAEYNNNGTFSGELTADLYKLTDQEKQNLGKKEQIWPYDLSTKGGMAMYNALVDINDKNIPNGEANTAKYHTELKFYVSTEMLENSNGTVTVRFGVDVPQQTTATQADNTNSDDTSLPPYSKDWTVFDNFHLLFGGSDAEPDLVLSEDFTNLDYLDNTINTFDARPMHLKRTFSEGKWNTIILPVNLSKADFATLFGSGSKLAKLDHLTATRIEFKSEEESNNVYMHANKPYIIWVDKDSEKSKWQKEYYTQYANRTDNGATYYTVDVPGDHFYLSSVKLEGNSGDSKQPYDFANDDKCIKGSLYTYADDKVAVNANDDKQEKLQAYGTLCKNFEGKTILTGHPTLAGDYIMKDNNMVQVNSNKSYGTKGFHCWFGAPQGSTNNTASALRVWIDGVADGTTAIEGITDDSATAAMYADGIYNLNGVKVKSGNDTTGLPAGIYIVGGKKHVVE